MRDQNCFNVFDRCPVFDFARAVCTFGEENFVGADALFVSAYRVRVDPRGHFVFAGVVYAFAGVVIVFEGGVCEDEDCVPEGEDDVGEDEVSVGSMQFVKSGNSSPVRVSSRRLLQVRPSGTQEDF